MIILVLIQFEWRFTFDSYHSRLDKTPSQSQAQLQRCFHPGGRHEAKKNFDIVKKFLWLKMLEIRYRTDVYTGILFFEPPNLQK